jgi:hypothetical protein
MILADVLVLRGRAISSQFRLYLQSEICPWQSPTQPVVSNQQEPDKANRILILDLDLARQFLVNYVFRSTAV